MTRNYISAGLAEPARCPECGAQLEDVECRVYCPDYGYKHNKGVIRESPLSNRNRGLFVSHTKIAPRNRGG